MGKLWLLSQKGRKENGRGVFNTVSHGGIEDEERERR